MFTKRFYRTHEESCVLAIVVVLKDALPFILSCGDPGVLNRMEIFQNGATAQHLANVMEHS